MEQDKVKQGGSKKLILVLVLVVLGLFGYVFFKEKLGTKEGIKPPEGGQKQVSSPTPTPAYYAVIGITKNGFVPATLKVQKNTQVTWTNKDTKEHKIESDPHPAHTSLTGLSSQIFSNNASYSYIFTNSGTFTYHDEKNPLKVKGTIIVE